MDTWDITEEKRNRDDLKPGCLRLCRIFLLSEDVGCGNIVGGKSALRNEAEESMRYVSVDYSNLTATVV